MIITIGRGEMKRSEFFFMILRLVDFMGKVVLSHLNILGK